MNTVVTVLYETDRLDASELRWALRAAVHHGGDITFLVPAERGSSKVDLTRGAKNDPPTTDLAESLRELLDQELTPQGWVAAAQQPSTEAETGPRDPERASYLCRTAQPANRTNRAHCPLDPARR
jgi:hypothetical protein